MRLSIRTLLRALICLAVASHSLLAQEGGRLPRGRGRIPQTGGTASDEPKNWVSIAFGYQISPFVRDGATSSTWDVGQGFPLRVSLERSVGTDASVGVAGTFVRMPLVYSSTGPEGCNACDAHATVASYGLVAHVGGGLGFFNV